MTLAISAIAWLTAGLGDSKTVVIIF